MRLLWGLGVLLACFASGHPAGKDERRRVRGAPGSRAQQLWDDLTCQWPVIPKILQGDRTLRLEDAALGQKGFPARLQIALEVDGGRFLVDLERNWELLAGAQGLAYYLPNGTKVIHQTSPEGNCCYRGSVQGFLDSWANVCICSGLSGLLFLSRGQSYSLESHARGNATHHRAYRLRAVKHGPGECRPISLSHGQLHPQPEQPLLRRGKRQAEPEHRYVELVMVADRAEFKLYFNLDQIQIRMLEIASYMDGFYRPLGLRVALVHSEVWNDRDRVSMEGRPHAVLERFLRWRQQALLPEVPHDSAQLITGSPLIGGTTGVSTHASICSGRSGGLSMDHSVSPLVMASTLSHQLGHNLGLSHDGAGCGCDGSSPNLPPGRSCIMEPPGLMPGLSFSHCSHQQLQEILRSSRVWCLRDVPEPTRLTKPRCGNRLVEAGEGCDCGLREECADPCCNATECQLMAGAQCATGGACCHECKLRGAGFVCRSTQNECDLPEFCDGTSPRCPTNVHKQDGTPCAEGGAICYGGACPTYMGQCQELWGPGSVPVSDACMASLNSRGDLEGHCGQLPNGSYVPCAQRNAQCGRLQCQGGSANLTNPNKVGGSAACPHNTPSPADDLLDLAMVLPGTACGPDKFCIDQRCQDLPALKFPVCLCNGHGVCNNKGNCHCQPGWGPPDCRSSGRGGSADSGSPATERGSATSTALILSSLLLVLLLILGLYCAKRVGLHKRLCQFGKGTSCQYRITQPEPRSYSRAPPERPQPPQWRQNTELQLMPTNKLAPLGDARPDPPSKPLPPDPTPKGQQAVATDRPAPPTRPLPADPIPKAAQPPGQAKPPPPRKPLPSDPPRTELSAVPTYDPQVLMLPARPPPPPPPTSAGLPGHVQEA
ncbi:disintegrin and metalloproteinase domain-containing protein 15 isoform X2 [Paroedura picta]|uniref:disintegrin and metalloproteinase domain-containing protein 15 isoform X2 n=1 Tax=Paroedura picta TaxID=143630 RepID=UPI004055F59C